MGRLHDGAWRNARSARLIVLACCCAALAACNPSPSFPSPEQPLVGVVVQEKEVIAAGGTPVEVTLASATLRIPAGAVPSGTRLLIRLLRGIVKTPPADSQGVWTVVNAPGAVQILPTSVTFAVPATLTVEGFLLTNEEGGALYAEEGDAAWQRRGVSTITPGSIFGNDISTPIDAPHLWSFESRPLPDPRGTYRQQELTCAEGPVSPVPADTLELGVSDYVWRRTPNGAACSFVEAGQFSIDHALPQIVFTPTGGPPRQYRLYVRLNGFEITHNDAVECPAGRPESQTRQLFVLTSTGGVDGGTDAGTADGSTVDGGCTTDAMERADARVD